MAKNFELEQAVNTIKKGGIVIFPTDTAFGIGCRIDDPKAVFRLFEIKRRPHSQPVPVLVDSIQMAQNYLITPLPNNVRRLMEDFWPAGLTVIYKCRKNRVSPLVRGGGKTIGVRIPNHKKALSIIKGVGVPVLGPSANFHNAPTPYKFTELDQDFIRLVDLTVRGSCQDKKASTVIDCTVLPWRILRQGKTLVNLKKYS